MLFLCQLVNNNIFLIFSVDSEVDSEDSPTKDVTNSVNSTFTSTSATIGLNQHLADGVVDSGVDSESTTTPSSPEDTVPKEGTDQSNKSDEHKVDSDVMETAEMLLSLSGSNILNTNKATMNGSNNEFKTASSRGLKDEFIKSLRLQKKEKFKVTTMQQKAEGDENEGRIFHNVYSINLYLTFKC